MMGKKWPEEGEIWHTPLQPQAHLRYCDDGVILADGAMWG
jgi:hypothetical protein